MAAMKKGLSAARRPIQLLVVPPRRRLQLWLCAACSESSLVGGASFGPATGRPGGLAQFSTFTEMAWIARRGAEPYSRDEANGTWS